MGLDDGGYTTPYIDVDVDSMRDAAEELTRTANRLVGDIDTLMEKAALPLAVFAPDADVYRAYAFWWGRWSALVETAEPAIRGAASTTAKAADGFTTVDTDGRIELTLPEGG
ncbi:hypothetical protein [Nocardioides sp. TF02-7]|uniref:hypothetical protein n=1 Tax=Nocardioides sp. TF02-7 TaxID=2917724 RepID=UPI001F054BEF|nr:hypothetical protein [Nocardioides sp. TF02-7]UMG94227.1 hypothetical protein MF408_09515 [Nocardioides sp. TF02-7]